MKNEWKAFLKPVVHMIFQKTSQITKIFQVASLAMATHCIQLFIQRVFQDKEQKDLEANGIFFSPCTWSNQVMQEVPKIWNSCAIIKFHHKQQIATGSRS